MEVDLLARFPRGARILERPRTDKDRELALKFDKEFFDGDRQHGYGGYHYHERFWMDVAKDIVDHFQLEMNDTLLDVGCAKGFLMHDLETSHDIECRGLDISTYAIENAIETQVHNIIQADAMEIPYATASFDCVISLNTIHNLEPDDCLTAVHEIERVSRGKSYIVVDAYRTVEERRRILDWNLTAKTILHTEDWKALFEEAGYTGDYGWTII